ncbi:hypothetical protein NECAME_10797 [Necator americanus]|uniref:Uncharacterized protein n=1 Tax=Necator americanus TaxID=51031 RepID=W2T9X7_NECAM|nr:hypothetical protein NECAME_10797 [Necator americanus]ETN77787.1 hypothetical protein NECAME_10797 [Necator americanus]
MHAVAPNIHDVVNAKKCDGAASDHFCVSTFRMLFSAGEQLIVVVTLDRVALTEWTLCPAVAERHG